jgi:hypothetical protein
MGWWSGLCDRALGPEFKLQCHQKKKNKKKALNLGQEEGETDVHMSKLFLSALLSDNVHLAETAPKCFVISQEFFSLVSGVNHTCCFSPPRFLSAGVVPLCPWDKERSKSSLDVQTELLQIPQNPGPLQPLSYPAYHTNAVIVSSHLSPVQGFKALRGGALWSSLSYWNQ